MLVPSRDRLNRGHDRVERLQSALHQKSASVRLDAKRSGLAPGGCIAVSLLRRLCACSRAAASLLRRIEAPPAWSRATIRQLQRRSRSRRGSSRLIHLHDPKPLQNSSSNENFRQKYVTTLYVSQHPTRLLRCSRTAEKPHCKFDYSTYFRPRSRVVCVSPRPLPVTRCGVTDELRGEARSVPRAGASRRVPSPLISSHHRPLLASRSLPRSRRLLPRTQATASGPRSATTCSR